MVYLNKYGIPVAHAADEVERLYPRGEVEWGSWEQYARHLPHIVLKKTLWRIDAQVALSRYCEDGAWGCRVFRNGKIELRLPVGDTLRLEPRSYPVRHPFKEALTIVTACSRKGFMYELIGAREERLKEALRTAGRSSESLPS
jgi:hypothetical protein